LEAQEATLARFAAAEGYQLIQTFTEVETGKGSDALVQGETAEGLALKNNVDVAVGTNSFRAVRGR
jgi:hypothetical protein